MQENPEPSSSYRHPYEPVNSTMILVLGILGVTVCGLFTGIPAWIMGNKALESIRSGVGDPKEEQLVNAGRILGMVSVVLGVCGCAYWMLVMAGIAGSAVSPRSVR